jgi:hypothetical protein
MGKAALVSQGLIMGISLGANHDRLSVTTSSQTKCRIIVATSLGSNHGRFSVTTSIQAGVEDSHHVVKADWVAFAAAWSASQQTTLRRI